MVKVAVVGSRSRNKKVDEEMVSALVNGLQPRDVVVSGGCVGIDTWAEKFAKECKLETLIFLPDFKKYPLEESPSKAYFKRNKQIAEACDIVYAFVKNGRGRSGVENTIRYAKELDKPVVVIAAPRYLKQEEETIRIPGIDELTKEEKEREKKHDEVWDKWADMQEKEEEQR